PRAAAGAQLAFAWRNLNGVQDNAPGPVEEAARMDREVIRRLWASGLPSAAPARVRAHRLLQRCAPAWTAVAVFQVGRAALLRAFPPRNWRPSSTRPTRASAST